MIANTVPIINRAAPASHPALSLIEQEAWALLTRLNQVKPLALQETMVPAAAGGVGRDRPASDRRAAQAASI